MDVFGFCRHDNASALCLSDVVTQSLGDSIEGQRPVRQTLDEFLPVISFCCSGLTVLYCPAGVIRLGITRLPGQANKCRISSFKAPSEDCALLRVGLSPPTISRVYLSQEILRAVDQFASPRNVPVAMGHMLPMLAISTVPECTH